MDMSEFNEAKLLLQPWIVKAQKSGNESAIADLYIAAAMHKLALLPINLEDDLPQPICTMLFIPVPGMTYTNHNRIVNTYVVPIDQV